MSDLVGNGEEILVSISYLKELQLSQWSNNHLYVNLTAPPRHTVERINGFSQNGA